MAEQRVTTVPPSASAFMRQPYQSSIWTDEPAYHIVVHWSQSLIFSYLQFDGPHSFEGISASANSYFVGNAQPGDAGLWTVSAFLTTGLMSCHDMTCTYAPGTPQLEAATGCLLTSNTSTSLDLTVQLGQEAYDILGFCQGVKGEARDRIHSGVLRNEFGKVIRFL